MSTIAIVYHSQYGHTKVLAEAIRRGAAGVAGVEASLIGVEDLPAPDKQRNFGGRWSELDSADAIVFGSPTYMGSVSAGLKAFMESSSAIWSRQGWKDKIAAGFTNSGGLSGDKLNTLVDLAVFAAQHGMIWVSQGLMQTDETDDAEAVNRLGAYLGAMAQSQPGRSPDEAPPASDRHTAELFGARVAQATNRWVQGAASGG